jgi:hypothetical protein
MAFIRKNFTPIGGQSTRGNGMAAYAYRTDDATADIDTTGYFNEVKELLTVGDLITVVRVDDVTLPVNSQTVAGVERHYVLTITAANVDVSDGNADAVTNTD